MIVPFVVWTASLTIVMLVCCVEAPATAAGFAWAFGVAVALGVVVQWLMHGAPHHRHRRQR